MKMKAGFTLIELVMAMAVFSFLLLLVSSGFIQVVRIHQAGIASRSTQQNARLVLDALAKDIRVSALASSATVTSQYDRLCLAKGSQTLQYAVDTTTGDLKVNTITPPAAGTCPAPANFTGWRTLNDDIVRVEQFRAVTTLPAQPGLGTAMVTLTLASRNNLNALDPASNPPRTRCLPGAGSQFCAVTTLSSGATLRGGDGL